MFGRVVVRSIAALFLVLPAPSGGETNASAGVDAPVASVVIATPHDDAQEQVSDQMPDRTEDRAHDDTQAPAKVATLDPAEPSIESPVAAGPAIKSPALAEPFGLNTVPVVRGEVLTKWNGVGSDIRAENDILELCRASAELCPPAASFLAIIAQGRAQTGRAPHRDRQPRHQSCDPPHERSRPVGGDRPLECSARHAHHRLRRLRGLCHR
jgi:hypothetical protein